jgi:hypothetical protein
VGGVAEGEEENVDDEINNRASTERFQFGTLFFGVGIIMTYIREQESSTRFSFWRSFRR